MPKLFKRKKFKRKKILKSRRILYKFVNSTDPLVSVVIPVMNEKKTIAKVIKNVSKVHARTEVIVVANGSTDGSKQIAQKMGANVLAYDHPLGHDVGRSLGAREAKGDIILFADGDFIIPTRELIPLVSSIEKGNDVALNRYSGPTKKYVVHNVVAAKHALNVALYRPDLKGASMTTVPHAMSRRAIDYIGVENLAVPPIAHAIGIHKGLRIKADHLVNVGARNPRRRRKRQGKDPLEKLIIGDHLEAMNWLMGVTNARGNHTDLTRMRDRVR